MMGMGGSGGMHFFMWGPGGRGEGKRPSLSMYRRLLQYVGPYKGNLVSAAVLLVVSTALGLVWPQVAQRVIDLGLRDEGFLDVLILGLIVVLLVRGIIDGARQFVMAYTGERVIFDLRMAIVRHMQSLSLSFFNRRKTGELMSHVTSDTTLVHGVITQTIIQVLGQVLTLAGGIAVIFVMNWRLALLTLVVAPPIAVLGQRMGRRIRDLSRQAQDAQGEAVGVLQEAIAEVRVVQAFTREEYEAARFREKLVFTFNKTIERARIAATTYPIIGFLGLLSSIIVLWYGGHQVVRGEMTAGMLVAFLLYMGMVAGPVGMLASQWTQVQQAFGAADRIFALLDTAPEIQDRPGAAVLPPVQGEIHFDVVSFRYGVAGLEPAVLDGITTTFRPGETTALVGPSGAGKTTLVNLVGRFYDPVSGRIVVDGHDLRDVTIRSLREQIAVVPQEPILFAEAARSANATEFIARLPSGLATIVGERGVRLSVGQRQRVAIARALLRDAPILLLDEATSSLDNESEYLVQQALDRLMRGRTTIVIAHRLSTVERADRILVLDHGRIVEEGTHGELLTLGGLYHRLYTRRFVDEDSVRKLEPAEPIIAELPAAGEIRRLRVVR